MQSKSSMTLIHFNRKESKKTSARDQNALSFFSKQSLKGKCLWWCHRKSQPHGRIWSLKFNIVHNYISYPINECLLNSLQFWCTHFWCSNLHKMAVKITWKNPPTKENTHQKRENSIKLHGKFVWLVFGKKKITSSVFGGTSIYQQNYSTFALDSSSMNMKNENAEREYNRFGKFFTNRVERAHCQNRHQWNFPHIAQTSRYFLVNSHTFE